jgi:acetyltransferase-like isoleucine patch superfamily enzyme
VVRGAVDPGLVVSGNPAQPVGCRQQDAAIGLQSSSTHSVTTVVDE